MLCSDPPYDVTVWTQLLAGSIVSTLSTFSTYWVTQSEYNEFGANVIHRKCP
jgi:actin-related protein